jgi:lysophospholipase L1-like esterase
LTTILVFGGSIAYGAYDKVGGYAQRLRSYLEEKLFVDPDSNFTLFNLGIGGDNSKFVLERFEPETKARLAENEETIFIFDIGKNDSVYDNTKKEVSIPIKDYIKNLSRLIKLARKYSNKIVFMGLGPVNETLVDPIPWYKDHAYKNYLIQQYNEALMLFCKKNDLYFVDVYAKFSSIDFKKLLDDGVHPNTKGHELIFKILKDYLEKNKII